MRLLKNFTIRIVMLAILGLFCLLWSGVGLFSLHSLSKISEGNDIDRHLVHQMVIPPFLGAFKSRGHAAFARCCFGV